MGAVVARGPVPRRLPGGVIASFTVFGRTPEVQPAAERSLELTTAISERLARRHGVASVQQTRLS